MTLTSKLNIPNAQSLNISQISQEIYEEKERKISSPLSDADNRTLMSVKDKIENWRKRLDIFLNTDKFDEALPVVFSLSEVQEKYKIDFSEQFAWEFKWLQKGFELSLKGTPYDEDRKQVLNERASYLEQTDLLSTKEKLALKNLIV